MSTDSIVDKLKAARSFLGKDQKEMAALCRMAHRSWQRYEQGEGLPSGQVFEALTELGFNITWFFRDDVPMRTEEERATHIDTSADADLACTPSDNLGLGESVELLAKIYHSGNKVLVRAIAANLNAFGEAIDNKALAAATMIELEQMKNRMLVMEKKVAGLESIPKKVVNGM
ncbi:MAG: helix-turn-helix domain-containing protein [Desulfobulbaceae bacterium]|nr:helix-turn-helix domain-containing protein [Desulfobulbaceae bacterium]